MINKVTVRQETHEERTETRACDLISRQAAIDMIRKWKKYETTEGLVDRISKLPSAQPQRKKGKWIHDGYAFKGGIDWMHCSECGHKDSWSAATRTPFCAWCGARMEEPEDIPMEYFENGGR